MLDDMEDGDAFPCDRTAKQWTLDDSGKNNGNEPPPLLPSKIPSEIAVSRDIPSLRAMHLAAASRLGNLVVLTLPLAGRDLTPYEEIAFWARSDNPGTFPMAVALMPRSSGLAYYDTDIMVTNEWGGPFVFRIREAKNGLGATLSAAEVAAPYAVAFNFVTSDTGVWIDDVHLRRKP